MFIWVPPTLCLLLSVLAAGFATNQNKSRSAPQKNKKAPCLRAHQAQANPKHKPQVLVTSSVWLNWSDVPVNLNVPFSFILSKSEEAGQQRLV